MFGIVGADVPKTEWKVLELPDKNVKVDHCSCDNTGAFSLVISDKGVAYFGGNNKKGEAGEPGIVKFSINFGFTHLISLSSPSPSPPPPSPSPSPSLSLPLPLPPPPLPLPLPLPPPLASRQQQVKPMKLKRMARLKDQHIVSGACGAHTTCLVSKDGKVFMFGYLEDDILDKTTGMHTALGGAGF